MYVRPLVAADLVRLNELAAASGYPYPDVSSPLIEAALAVCDEDGKLICAAAFERIVQGFLWIDRTRRPAACLAAIRALHEPLAKELLRHGYHEANVFIPPKLERSFGKRLERSFAWVRNWASWAKSF